MKTPKKERRERQSMLTTHLAIEASDLEKEGNVKESDALWEAISAILEVSLKRKPAELRMQAEARRV